MEGERRPPWYVEHGSTPSHYAFFISHVSGDTEEVIRLKSEIDAISGRGGKAALRCFLDVHDWKDGVPNLLVIKEELLAAQHMFVWASPNYLKQATRGWVWAELIYADLIEQSLAYDSLNDPRLPFYPFVAPVFRKVAIGRVQRTPLLGYWQRSVMGHGKDCSIPETARKLVDFYEQNHFRSGGLQG